MNAIYLHLVLHWQYNKLLTNKKSPIFKQQYLAGQLAIVTGASNKLVSIGSAWRKCTVHTYLSFNFRMRINESYQPQVLIYYNSTSHLVEKVLGKIRSLGVQARRCYAGWYRRSQLRKILAAALENFFMDTINIIANNAGLGIVREKTASVPLEDWDYLFHINICGLFCLSRPRYHAWSPEAVLLMYRP